MMKMMIRCVLFFSPFLKKRRFFFVCKRNRPQRFRVFRFGLDIERFVSLCSQQKKKKQKKKKKLERREKTSREEKNLKRLYDIPCFSYAPSSEAKFVFCSFFVR